VGIVTGHGLDVRDFRVRVPVEATIRATAQHPDRPLGPTQPPVQWLPGIFLRGEAGHLPATNADVKETWGYISAAT
jgi:hypothetical protein